MVAGLRSGRVSSQRFRTLGSVFGSSTGGSITVALLLVSVISCSVGVAGSLSGEYFPDTGKRQSPQFDVGRDTVNFTAQIGRIYGLEFGAIRLFATQRAYEISTSPGVMSNHSYRGSKWHSMSTR